MNFATKALIPLLALVLTNLAVAADRSSCRAYEKTFTSAEVIEHIAAGKMQQMVDCGLDPDQGIPLEGALVTPLQFAAASGRPELIRQVVKAGANPNFAGTGDNELPPLELALSARKYDAAFALLELGARPDYALPGSGATSLMTLAYDKGAGKRGEEVARHLVEQGAHVNRADMKGNTALHLASRTANETYVQTLLHLGADSCLVNNKGQRPADVAPDGRDGLRQLLNRACSARTQKVLR